MLTVGSKGLDVKELQQNLKNQGFNLGPIDGIFGENTKSAVIQFQKKNGLDPDGIAGPKTQAKLRSQVFRPRPLQDFASVVDPGHGGPDPGAVDGKNDDQIYTEEDDVNLQVGLLVEQKLIAQGARSTITRSGEWLPSLVQRYQIANNFKADAFLSIHCNSGVAVAKGIETLYNPNHPGSLRLAQLVQAELIAATGATNRGVKIRTDLAVLNGTHMPAILTEMGFITNPGEEAKLNKPAYQALLADAIVRGVVRFKKGDVV